MADGRKLGKWFTSKMSIVGVIGGTGLYGLEGLEQLEEVRLNTPFGEPSSAVTRGRLGGTELLFISRHGPGHMLSPSEINYRANVYALKQLGASWCISVSAVGSLREELAPGHIVIPDQLIDRTRNRASTFFGAGCVGHVPFADPFCPVLAHHLFEAAKSTAAAQNSVHRGGTYVVMEGPAFSTRAESHLYRSWDASIIGMTGLPEAKLAREAEMAYATLGMITDYDCWRSETADVDIVEILETMKSNVAWAKQILSAVVPRLAQVKPSETASEALRYGIITEPGKITPAVREALRPIIGRYIG